MSDDTARAVGAGGSTVEIAGKQCQVRPLSVKELLEVERECLKTYKRQHMESFAESVDLLPEPEQIGAVRAELVKTSAWDKSNLPPKFGYDHSRIELTDGLRAWLVEATWVNIWREALAQR